MTRPLRVSLGALAALLAAGAPAAAQAPLVRGPACRARGPILDPGAPPGRDAAPGDASPCCRRR